MLDNLEPHMLEMQQTLRTWLQKLQRLKQLVASNRASLRCALREVDPRVPGFRLSGSCLVFGGVLFTARLNMRVAIIWASTTVSHFIQRMLLHACTHDRIHICIYVLLCAGTHTGMIGCSCCWIIQLSEKSGRQHSFQS